MRLVITWQNNLKSPDKNSCTYFLTTPKGMHSGPYALSFALMYPESQGNQLLTEFKGLVNSHCTSKAICIGNERPLTCTTCDGQSCLASPRRHTLAGAYHLCIINKLKRKSFFHQKGSSTEPRPVPPCMKNSLPPITGPPPETALSGTRSPWGAWFSASTS